MNANPFVLEPEAYVRDINVLKHYVNDCAEYLHVMTGQPKPECVAFIKESLKKGGEFEFVDPTVTYLERGENGDRVKKTGTLSALINTAVRERDLIAPNMTFYTSPDKNQTILVDFIDGNVAARGKAKKAMFVAKMAGNTLVEAIKKNEQTNKKLSNNSISGAHVSASTPLFNRTAHSTLTSNCRTTSGYGNANNEKFLSGNRHYWSPDIVRNNIISIVNNSDYKAIEQACLKYNIRYPSVVETLECIKFSSSLYWTAKADFKKIADLIGNLSPIQRAAFVYTGDLYQLMKLNDGVVRGFLDGLSARIDTPIPNAKEVIDSAPDDIKHLATQICEDGMRGMKNIAETAGTPLYDSVAATINNINITLETYRGLIKAFWVTPNVPASLAVFPDSIRRAAITSDTDSTIFTVQDWVIWHRDGLFFDVKANALAASIIFLAAQSIIHVLARMSANFGIQTKRIHQIAMKNEFKFPVFIPTQVAKHYFALVSVQEGNIFKEFDKEIKGVHLKSSNAPKVVMKQAQDMMLGIMHTIMAGEKVSINKLMKQIADIERDVVASIKKGSFEFFRKGQIKTAGSYTRAAEDSPYMQYTMWQEVFAPKYGNIQEPPYMTVKVSVELSSPAKTQTWIANMKDRDLASRIQTWLETTGRKHMGGSLMIPEQCVSAKGIPDEILDAIEVRKIILSTTTVFYIILESMGVYMLNNKNSRLCIDTH